MFFRNGLNLTQYSQQALFWLTLQRDRRTRGGTRLSHLGADHITLEGGTGVGDFEKNFLQALVGKKKVACSTNVTESLWEKKGKKYPAHQNAKKKILDDQKSPTTPPPPPLKS